MELFNKSGVLLSSLVILIGALIACQAKEDAVPPSTVIEAAALNAGPLRQSAAERRLREWAEQGSPVAQRELALRYLALPDKRGDALRLLQQAASGGDAQAAAELVALYRQSSALNDEAAASDMGNSLGNGRLVKDAAGAHAALGRY